MINVIDGDAIDIALASTEPLILCHIVNDSGGWGRGFVVPLGKKIPQAEARYRSWHKEGYHVDYYTDEFGVDVDFKLGNTQFVMANKNLLVANMIAQHGYEGIPVRYNAITRCMKTVFDVAILTKSKIIMPRIGCGLGGGNWEDVEEAIKQALPKITVVDFK